MNIEDMKNDLLKLRQLIVQKQLEPIKEEIERILNMLRYSSHLSRANIYIRLEDSMKETLEKFYTELEKVIV